MLAFLSGTRGRWVSLAAGLALPLCYSPFGWWWLAPILFAVLIAGWTGQSARERFWRGFWFGFGAFSTGTYWLYISIHGFGGAAPPFAIGVMLALIALMAAYHGIAGWLSGRLAPSTGAGFCLLGAPAAFTLVEWIRGWLFSGFPWLSVGYGQIDGPLAPWAPVFGIHGLSLLVLLIAGALALALSGVGRAAAAAAVGVVIVIAGLTLPLGRAAWTQPTGEPVRVALVQGGIGQERKWLPEEREATLALYREMTVSLAPHDLVIWPEAAVPALPFEVEDYLGGIRELARARDMVVLLGIVSYEPETDRFFNSLLSLGEDTGIYHKRHLVPYGEYFPVPAFVRDVLRLMNLPYQDISSGPDEQPHLEAGGVLLAPSICYEDVFAAELRDFLPEAGLLVNVSNDGWFGDSIAPHQHLQMARARALESGRYMLRSTNTGISAVIAPDGSVQASGPQFRPAVVSGLAEARTGSTPYVTWGDLPVVVLTVLLLGSQAALGRGRPTLP